MSEKTQVQVFFSGEELDMLDKLQVALKKKGRPKIIRMAIREMFKRKKVGSS